MDIVRESDEPSSNRGKEKICTETPAVADSFAYVLLILSRVLPRLYLSSLTEIISGYIFGICLTFANGNSSIQISCSKVTREGVLLADNFSERWHRSSQCL